MKTRAELEVGDVVTFIGDHEKYEIVEVKGDRIDVRMIGCNLFIVPVETVNVSFIETLTKKKELV